MSVSSARVHLSIAASVDHAGVSELSIGAVLAGGASRRMGEPKALVELAGRPLIAHAVSSVIDAGLEPVVVAKADSAVPDLGVPVLDEPAEPRHPLCGIVAALRYAETRPVVVIGCDMPFVPPSLLGTFGRLADPVAVASIDGEIEPLLARYEPAVEPALMASLRAGTALREAVAALHPRLVGEGDLSAYGDPNRIVLNVNSPEDLEIARSLVTRPDAP
jgi:molybdopterin-guanine dinucleotide biosynthesis protein A